VKISVVTTSLNHRDFLELTAASVLSQNGDFELEWVVVDGGSTDGTVEFLEGLQDPRIVWASEPDRGQTHALQKGMGRATGDVIGWLNSDDLYLPEALATVAAEFADHAEADWLIGRAAIIDVEGREIRRWITRYKDRVLAGYQYKRLLRENFINYNGVFWRRRLIKAVGPLDESLGYNMDFELWLRFGGHSDPLVISAVLGQFRLYDTSKSGDFNREQFDEQYRVACRHREHSRFNRLLHRLNVEKTVFTYRMMRLLGS